MVMASNFSSAAESLTRASLKTSSTGPPGKRARWESSKGSATKRTSPGASTIMVAVAVLSFASGSNWLRETIPAVPVSSVPPATSPTVRSIRRVSEAPGARLGKFHAPVPPSQVPVVGVTSSTDNSGDRFMSTRIPVAVLGPAFVRTTVNTEASPGRGLKLLKAAVTPRSELLRISTSTLAELFAPLGSIRSEAETTAVVVKVDPSVPPPTEAVTSNWALPAALRGPTVQIPVPPS